MKPARGYMAGNTAMAMDYGDTRVNVRFAVYYGEKKQKVMSDYSVNMSYGGIFIESENILPADTSLLVEFKLPRAEKPIRCKSRVAWTNEPENPKSRLLPSGMGVQFIDLALDDMHKVRSYIEEVGIKPSW